MPKDSIALIYDGNDGGTRYFHPKIKGLEVQRSTMDLRSRFGERILETTMDLQSHSIYNGRTCNRIQN